MTTANPQAVPTNSLSDSQPNPLPTPLSSGQPSDQPTLSVTPSTSSSADLWELAYEALRKKEPELVKDYNKQILGNATVIEGVPSRQSVETVLKKLLKDREKRQLKISFMSHSIKIRKQVDRLIEFLQFADPFVKDALNAQPYAALAWSSVSLLLPLLTSSTTQNEAMLDGFNSIGDLQVYWKACKETCLQSEHRQHYQRLVEPLVELYSHVFAYQAYVICHLSKAQHSRAWRNLTGPNFWTNRLKAIDELSKNCCKLIDPSREMEVQQNRDSQLQELQKLRIIQEKILQNEKEDKRDEKETRLLQDLAVAAGDYTRYKNLNPHRVDGTCEWFLTDDRFYTWRDSELPSLLWVSAGPGCGKSVLSKSLIDDGQLATCITTITISPSSVDAVTSRESTVCYFFFKEGGDGHMDSSHALCAFLHQLFTCPSTSGLIKYALQSYRHHGTTLTRKFSELWRILSDCVTSPDASEITCVLDALDECKEESRQEFIKTLKDFYSQSEKLSAASAKFKFLVTSRPYPDLETSFQNFRTTTAYLRFDGDEKSDQIRQEIDLVIDARLEDITDGFTARDKRKISVRLKSMDHRTYLWLHLTLNIIEKSPTEFGKRSDIEKLLTHLPSQISDAYEKILNRSTNPSRTKILLRIMLAAAWPLTLDKANVALTLAIQEQEPALYADVEPPEDKPAQHEQHPYLAYAANYWPMHFVLQEVTDADAFRRHARLLCNTAGHQASIWAPSYLEQRFLSWGGWSDLALASYLGLSEVVRDILSKEKVDFDIEVKDPWYSRTPLSWAAEGGHETVVKLLLQHGAKIEAKDSVYGKTPLSWAAIQGYEAVVKLLLENKADTEAKDSWYSRTPLSLAAELGHVAVVKLLLMKSAEIETKDSRFGQTPLSWAAKGGHEAVVKLLLENGAIIEAKDSNYGKTPLSWAAKQGYEAVVKLLLENGAMIKAKDSLYGQTPLSWATKGGHEAVVKLLLENGAMIEAKDSNYLYHGLPKEGTRPWSSCCCSKMAPRSRRRMVRVARCRYCGLPKKGTTSLCCGLWVAESADLPYSIWSLLETEAQVAIVSKETVYMPQ